ncbi:hypothetical protein A0256_14650 [Mucilaginibacter sp. PAMC 26640]|nr:hypothetical protein A0256_14650 [Mucilaginibacter sp. PAMC 26640]
MITKDELIDRGFDNSKLFDYLELTLRTVEVKAIEKNNTYEIQIAEASKNKFLVPNCKTIEDLDKLIYLFNI